jgi:TonB family protein
LPSWPYADVLAPSVVQAVVDAPGNVVSTVLLSPSGYDAADQRALELARAMRFTPSSHLTIGRMIFNWHTVPPPAMNAPAALP